MPNADGTPTQDELLEAQFSQEDESGDQEEVLGEPGEASGEGETGAVEPPAPRIVKVGKRDVPVDDIESLLEFQAWALQNPAQMGAFASYLRGDADFIEKQREAEHEAEDDLADVDPKIADRLKRQEDEISELREYTRQQVTSSTLQEANRAVNQAQEAIKTRFDLNEDELQELTDATANSGVLPGIRANSPDAAAATERALETIYWSTDKFRQREIQREIDRQDNHQHRKDLAAAIGGSSGSLDRGVPSDEQVAKMTADERRNAMANEIAASIRGTV